MSAITLEYPIENLPGLPAQEGSWFWVNVKAGKLRVSVPEGMPTEALAANEDDPAVQFVKNWSGKGTLLSPEEIDQDPRLAYLTAKHIH